MRQPSIKKMNKIRCHTCRNLVDLKECFGRGYLTTKSGYEKLVSVECSDCFYKDFDKCLKILNDGEGKKSVKSVEREAILAE